MRIEAPSTALIAIDLMPRIVSQNMGPHSGADVVARSLALADAVRAAGGLVVPVRVERPGVAEQPPGSGLVPEFTPRPGDLEIVKRTIGAFPGTGLEQALRDRRITTIILTGIATTMGVESTARTAADLGFDLIFAADAMSGMTETEHHHALTVTLPRFGEIRTTAEILARLG
ncbi:MULTISPECIES: isochorismatase family protein [unclassified Actinoplanes]|uniref:isochorismatase family protein n=1 Tax=unclassified Actinoplanes TaxID=2626549 RepID=UPI0005BE3FD4|nr:MULTISPECIES: isochorismatase family protein [unclassified Actinoplanes]